MSRRFRALARPPGPLLPLAALTAAAVAVVVITTSSGRGGAGHSSEASQLAPATQTVTALATGPTSSAPPIAANTQRTGPRTTGLAGSAATRPTDLAHDLGQMIVAAFPGTSPPAAFLARIRAGQIGGVILFTDNTGGGIPSVARAVVAQLQAAARSGRNPGLLIMTDQEGGQVKRLNGPPTLAASQMGDPGVAAAQGSSTAQLLRRAGVNVDLAPVADVSRVHGFIAQQQRSFGSTAARVAASACAFARSLSLGRVAYTLKHFPGLGSAVKSTDNGPVTLDLSASSIRTDEQAYQSCGDDPRALVMVSSAAYSSLTGSTPAVLSSQIYDSELPRAGVAAVTISDDLQAPAIANLVSPARRAINAGLDLLLYGQNGLAANAAYDRLLVEASDGRLRASRIVAAAGKIRALKRSLNLE